MQPYLNEILTKIRLEDKEILAQAHERYNHLIGIRDTGQINVEILNKDKVNFASLLKRTDDNLPIFSDNDCVEFMISVTGLPGVWCEAYKEYEFENEHGSIGELSEWSEREKRRIKFKQEQKILEQMYFDNFGKED